MSDTKGDAGGGGEVIGEGEGHAGKVEGHREGHGEGKAETGGSEH